MTGSGGNGAEVTGSAQVTGSADVTGSAVLRLVEVMDELRTRCPWDAKQTHDSLAAYLLEETYEALEALERSDLAALKDELGDVLLQVIFHAVIAAERTDGTGFTIDDVADGIAAKLIRRHPHVFGDVTVSGAEEVKRNWEQIKTAERASAGQQVRSMLDGVPVSQPALALAAQLQRRAAAAGAPGELADLRQDGMVSPLGAELFALVARARAEGLDPELELRRAARVFGEQVRAWERKQAASQPAGPSAGQPAGSAG
jgi:NTP pyrophosphatase (non-canonical NTP hydrolase)